MDTEEKRITNPCKKLDELPPVAAEWQQTAWCPDCDYYDRGSCVNPTRTDSNAACPFDGKALPLREVVVESNDDQPQKPRSSAPCNEEESQPLSAALEQTIKRQIMSRTRGRIQLLDVQLVGREVVIRVSAPCYYVKQLVLQGVLDVLRFARETEVQLDVQVVVCPAISGPGTW